VDAKAKLPNKKTLEAWLSIPTYKEALIKSFTGYLTGANVALGTHHADFSLRLGQTVVVDTAAVDQPWAIAGSNTTEGFVTLPADHTLRQSHTHGEADLSAWHFATRVQEPVVVLEAADTDWFFYGLALLEASALLRP